MHTPHELIDLERRLVGLQPPVVTLDRDRVLYEAGRAAALSGAVRHLTAFTMAGFCALGAILFGFTLREREDRLAAERALAAIPVATPALAAADPVPTDPSVLSLPSDELSPSSYLALRIQFESSMNLGRDLGPPGNGASRSAAQGPVTESPPLMPLDSRRLLDL